MTLLEEVRSLILGMIETFGPVETDHIVNEVRQDIIGVASTSHARELATQVVSEMMASTELISESYSDNICGEQTYYSTPEQAPWL